jgi:hypothetical protein
MSEFINPRTGKKAVVIVDIRIMVEVEDSDMYHDMVQQAVEILPKRVVESKGFYPFRKEIIHVHPDVTVDELKQHTMVDPRVAFYRK